MRVAVTLALVVAACVGGAVAGGSCTTSHSFDYFEFVRDWPPTGCTSGSCNNTDAYFTIHGACASATARRAAVRPASRRSAQSTIELSAMRDAAACGTRVSLASGAVRFVVDAGGAS
jgi:hypothetical protein